MQSILVAAMLQSQQVWLPNLHEPTNVQIIIQSSSQTQKLIAHCEESEKAILSKMNIANSTQILIGPEGDFTIAEIEMALQQQYQPVSLGNTRLRTETAGIVASALLVNA
jgi:16S rRNA (uracil1498-N3)-methyltransferase